MKSNEQIYETPSMEYISLEMESCVLNESNEVFNRKSLDGAY